MKISLPLSVVRSASEEERKFLSAAFKDDFAFRQVLGGRKTYDDTHRMEFNMGKISPDNIASLWSLANRNDVDTMTINKIMAWRNAINNHLDAEVPSLPGLKTMLLTAMKDNQYKWLMRQSDDGYMLPYLVTNISHHPRSKYNAEHVNITVVCGYLYSSTEYTSDDKAKEYKMSIDFYNGDLVAGEDKKNIESDEFDSSSMYSLDDPDLSDDDEENDEDISVKKKPAKKSAKGGAAKKTYTRLTLLQILAEENLFLPTDETLATYFKHFSLATELAKLMGSQYTVAGKAYIKSSSTYYSSRTAVQMSEEDALYRVVIDMRGIPSTMGRVVETSIYGMKFLPYHPYLRAYNLTKYSYVDVHAASLVPYKYNKEILKNMIVPQKLKDYLSAIIGGANVYKDIIAGKSGGMIILASGQPGIGKTLTAETYAEQMELPLYQIQSSQLGLDIDKIEENLSHALRRAERWNAVLLIDECDTYVRKRGGDIVQNCIVGVWLRLLEYFSGIMFLTTNQHDIIDPAILSRCTSHIKYEMPTVEERTQIIRVHALVQGINVTQTVAEQVAKAYEMSGRDIRNMLKNINKVYHKEGKVTLTMDKLKAIQDYITFVK